VTDAEIVAWHRERASERVDHAWRCRTYGKSAALREEADASDASAAAHARAADAIEENVRLRAAIESVEQLQRWANEMTHYHKGEWVLYADVIAALRKPDAAGGDHA
jgi:hypothetical protein